MGSWSIWHWLVVLAIVALGFRTKRLRNIGEDVSAALKRFLKGKAEPYSQTPLKADPPAQDATSEKQSEHVEPK